MVVGGAAGTGGGDQEQAGRGAGADRGGAPVDAVVDRARDRRGGRGGSGVVGPFGGGAGASRGRRERGDGERGGDRADEIRGAVVGHGALPLFGGTGPRQGALARLITGQRRVDYRSRGGLG